MNNQKLSDFELYFQIDESNRVNLFAVDDSAVPKSLAELGRRIDDIHRRLDHFAITDDTVVAGLADIYSSVLSPLGHRIQVYGKPELLKQQQTQNKIRALLLAGIRSAVLWRQMGGKRRHFFFAKRNQIRRIKEILIIWIINWYVFNITRPGNPYTF